MFEPATHVIFDFDGLLMDTESCYSKATNQVAESYGKTFNDDHKMEVVGLPPRLCSQRILDILQLPLSLDQFMSHVDEKVVEILPQVDLMPGSEKLIRHFQQHSIPMAIATSSPSCKFVDKTRRYQELFHSGKFFSHFVLGDDPQVTRHKPHPEPYLVCADRFETKPEGPSRVLVFEDSPIGAKAALDAGFQCVFVNSLLPLHSTINATLHLQSLTEFNPSHFSLPPL